MIRLGLIVVTCLLLMTAGCLGQNLEVNGLHLGIPTNEVNALLGNPKSFETKGGAGKQRPIRSYYGPDKTLPAIEWDEGFKVTRIAGNILSVHSKSIRVGDRESKAIDVLGPPGRLDGNKLIYKYPKCRLEVYLNKAGNVKMFNLKADKAEKQ